MSSRHFEPTESDDPALVATVDSGDIHSSATAALYVVATPIGNLADISRRAVATLRSVSWVAAEDTRSSRPLLQSLGIGTARCLTLHAHNERQQSARILDLIAEGAPVALITDAGTPGISDPGAQLVADAHARGIPVVPIPGASATTTLLSAAGLPGGRFFFEGFLPTRQKQREARLQRLAASGEAFMLFEAPHRVEALAADLLKALEPERVLVVGRELTKRFEQIARLPVGDFPAWLEADANHRRGEFALLVFGRPQTDEAEGTEAATAPSEIGLKAMQVLAATMPPRQAAKLAARISGDAADLLYRSHARPGIGRIEEGE